MDSSKLYRKEYALLECSLSEVLSPLDFDATVSVCSVKTLSMAGLQLNSGLFVHFVF